MKKTVFVLMLVFFPGCSESSHQSLNKETARSAIAKYIECNPDAFVSPGLTESAEEVRRAHTISKEEGKMHIGHFWVDLNNKVYTLGHHYGPDDANQFETWQWNGKFILDSSNQWVLGEPNLIKSFSD
jgi:hypothetical protein